MKIKHSGKFTLTPARGETSIVFYVFFLMMYVTANVITTIVAQSSGTLLFAGNRVPFTVLAGVFTSLANIFIIFLVIFFKKAGFITALILLLTQFPILLRGFFFQHNPTSIPGIFTDLFTLVAAALIYQQNKRIDRYRAEEFSRLREQQRFSQRLFEQTATSLVNAIDAKDVYSHGHSLRVAEYSRMIAKALGKDEDECYRIYYAALLHDVGKIGIPIAIINKKGKLTEEEYDVIKSHPVKGNQILSSISEYPYLSIGAHYHHERYDGKGYPSRLKGDDIPEIARIISVADAYDAMTSNRSYRDAIPQQLVREEMVKGAGTQFDPVFAKIMQNLIDQDVNYEMKEQPAVSELAGQSELVCGPARERVSDGIRILQEPVHIHLEIRKDADFPESPGGSLILFDSLDERFHDDERTIRDLNYFEYCEIPLKGQPVCRGARDLLFKVAGIRDSEVTPAGMAESYDIEAVKCSDHVRVRIDSGHEVSEITVALPDSSRYVYIGLTGEHCRISDVNIRREETPVPADAIERIAEKITYIDGPEGDLPNLQIDNLRTGATKGTPVNGKAILSFHSMSLPTARLVWHCPCFVLFASADGCVDGPGYREFALIRLDGEVLDPDGRNIITAEKDQDFAGWDDWKAQNKKGLDVTVSFTREGNAVVTRTKNLGISVENITSLPPEVTTVYAALTGDQVALTKIRIS